MIGHHHGNKGQALVRDRSCSWLVVLGSLSVPIIRATWQRKPWPRAQEEAWSNKDRASTVYSMGWLLAIQNPHPAYVKDFLI